MRVRHPVAVAAVVLGLLGPWALGAERPGCRAEVRATPRADEVHADYVYKVFGVELESSEDCATVYVDFVATETLFNGEQITVTVRGHRKVTSTHTTYKVKHRIARDSELASWEFKVARCAVCGLE